MILPDLTARTELGAVDLVPFLRRLRGDHTAPVAEGETRAAVLAFHDRGWSVERIGRATSMPHDRIRGLIANPHARARDRVGADESARYRRRLAERELVDGRLVHPRAPHGGKPTGYKSYGCRCIPCIEAATENRRRS